MALAVVAIAAGRRTGTSSLWGWPTFGPVAVLGAGYSFLAVIGLW